MSCRFPLLTGSRTTLEADLNHKGWAATLQDAGFDPHVSQSFSKLVVAVPVLARSAISQLSLSYDGLAVSLVAVQ